MEKEDDDELKQLRASAEELRQRGKGIGGQVEKERRRGRSPGTSGDEEKKKKKKRKKMASRIQGKKSLDSLFGSTGLDPKAEIRRKVKKKARKVARRTRNKKRGRHRREAAAPARVPRVARGTIRICSNLPHRLNGFGDNARERLR